MIVSPATLQSAEVIAALQSDPWDFLTLCWLADQQSRSNDTAGAERTVAAMRSRARGAPELEAALEAVIPSITAGR